MNKVDELRLTHGAVWVCGLERGGCFGGLEALAGQVNEIAEVSGEGSRSWDHEHGTYQLLAFIQTSPTIKRTLH